MTKRERKELLVVGGQPCGNCEPDQSSECVNKFKIIGNISQHNRQKLVTEYMCCVLWILLLAVDFNGKSSSSVATPCSRKCSRDELRAS